jgi:hypothetical protein
LSAPRLTSRPHAARLARWTALSLWLCTAVRAPARASGVSGESAGSVDEDRARKQACVDDFTAGQTLRGDHALRAARAKLVACAQEACPAAVRKDCAALLEQVDAALPSVVARARDGEGHDLVDVSLRVDGEPAAARLDGKAIPLDPGAHVIRFERATGANDANGAAGPQSVEVKIVLSEGDKLRAVDATFPVPTRPPIDDRPRASRAGPPAGAWILGGVAVVGLGSFAYFGLKGRSEILSLRERCDGACPQDEVDAAHRKLIVADVSLGVGLVTGGLATWLFLRERPAEQHARIDRVDFVATPGGGVALIGGRF